PTPLLCEACHGPGECGDLQLGALGAWFSLYFRAMTGFAQERCRFIEKHRLAIHNFDEAVAFVTRNSLVAALQGELCPAMVEVRGLPALGIVAGGTVRLSLLLGELFCMNIRVA